jgi:hypothetical protein
MRPRLANVEKCTCPYCHAVLYLNHAESRTYHEAPACQKWLDFCNNTRARNEGKIQVIEVDGLKPRPS